MGDSCCDNGAVQPEPVVSPPVPVWRVRELQAAIASGATLLISLALSEPWGTVAMLTALVIGAATFVPGALRALARGRLGVSLLMTIAAAGAVALGEYGEAAMLAFLFSIAEGLEGYAVARTKHSLRGLLELVPPTAQVRRNGDDLELPTEALEVGDTLVVKPGERIATDGLVTSGRSAVDTSVVTGESVPVEVDQGVEVYAGTINGAGVLEVRVTATTAGNSLARLVHIVHEAQERKGRGQRLAERLAKPLVPGVMGLAAVIAGIGSLVGDPAVWIERALVVLVAAAPCAFALSVPVAVVAAIGTASKAGVLLKGGASVESLGSIRVVALDKTGTLTRNQARVIEVIPMPGTDQERVLAIAAALEVRSEHPLAAAILAANTSDIPSATDVTAVPGNGLYGTVDGYTARLGKPGYIDPARLSSDITRLQDNGATTVLIEHGSNLIGAIAVRDEIRPEAASEVENLTDQGINVVMLTGDNSRTAAAIAAEAGITDIRAELRPEDKARIIAELKPRGPVAMVGDGINDAPALATADTGIAMGAMGSDIAIEAADVALMGEDLRRLPDAIAHTMAARRILKQNLFMSGAILVALVPLAAFGTLGLATVVAVHELAEVLVIGNGIRAGRRKYLPLHPATSNTPRLAHARTHAKKIDVTASTTPTLLPVATSETRDRDDHCQCC